MKKLTALLLALVMVLAMNVSALAANTKTSTKNSDKGIASTDNTIEIAKQLVFKNAEEGAVREPNITYTYTISSVNPNNATVTDKDGISATVKAGVMAAVGSATSDVTFADTATQTATAAGNAVTKYASFTFDPSKFTQGDPAVLTPGIYRYKITESTGGTTKDSVGIKESTAFDENRYLDVYVKWADDAHTTLQIYGYVLYKNGTAGGTETISHSIQTTIDEKSEGFVDVPETIPADPTDPSSSPTTVQSGDVYETENLYIHKTTTGDLADKNNLFPIKVTLTAPDGVTNVKLDVPTITNADLTTQPTDGIQPFVPAWGDVEGHVKDGGEIAITGIPKGAKVSVVETNNTADSYKVKAGSAADGADLLAEKNVAKETAADKTKDVELTEKKDIYFTNTLNTVSQTGVVLRFAPYAIMLGAGVALFIILKVRKNKAVEEA